MATDPEWVPWSSAPVWAGESRQIKQRGVYAITALFSIFAQLWSNVGTMEFSVLGGDKGSVGTFEAHFLAVIPLHGMIESKPIGSMYAIYGNIYHQYTPNVSIYTIHGSVMGNKRDG